MSVETKWTRMDRAVAVVLVAAPFLIATAYLVKGGGYVLDDWYLLRNAVLDGAWGAAGRDAGAARPGSYPVFAVMFGLLGSRPVPSFLLLASITGSTAVLTFRLLRRFLDGWMAAMSALTWVLLPTHTSTDYYLTCSIVAVSQLCLTASLLLLARRRSRLTVAFACFLIGASVATYEASLPVAVVGAILVPWRSRGRPETVLSACALGACAIPCAWIALHWLDSKQTQDTAQPVRLLLANFGWGVTPGAGTSPMVMPLVVTVLLGIAAAVARVVLPSFRADQADYLVLVGVLLMALGFAPFVQYYYEPQGAGDRANYLSAVGGSMVWVGVAAFASRIDRRISLGALGLLLTFGSIARAERSEVWSTAAQDARAIAEAAGEQLDDGTDRLVIGPEPIVRWNVAAFLDDSNLQGAVDIETGNRSVRAEVARDAATWTDAPSEDRLDISGISELDDLEVLGG